MRLELNIFDITDVRFGNTTMIKDGVLFLNRKDLQGLLEEDKRLGRVDIETALPLGRIAETDDIADVAVFLASNASRYVTGQTILMEGVGLL